MGLVQDKGEESRPRELVMGRVEMPDKWRTKMR